MNPISERTYASGLNGPDTLKAFGPGQAPALKQPGLAAGSALPACSIQRPRIVQGGMPQAGLSTAPQNRAADRATADVLFPLAEMAAKGRKAIGFLAKTADALSGCIELWSTAKKELFEQKRAGLETLKVTVAAVSKTLTSAAIIASAPQVFAAAAPLGPVGLAAAGLGVAGALYLAPQAAGSLSSRIVQRGADFLERICSKSS